MHMDFNWLVSISGAMDEEQRTRIDTLCTQAATIMEDCVLALLSTRNLTPNVLSSALDILQEHAHRITELLADAKSIAV